MQPMFTLVADQRDVTETIRDRMLSLRLTDESGTRSDTLEIQLDDRDGKIAWPRHGAELAISLSVNKKPPQRMGLYVVDEVEHTGPPSTLIVRGKAADMRASIKAPKTRSWHNITLGAVVQTIAGEHELTAKISEPLAAITVGHIDQTHESDLHLLTRLARQHDAVTKPIAGHLVFVAKGEAKSATGKELPVIELSPHDIISHRLTQAERGKYLSVKAYWHDIGHAEKRTVLVGDGDPVYSVRYTYMSAQEAAGAAKAKLHSLQRGTASLSLTLVGKPELQAEGKIRLTGFREPVDGEWLITRVEHQLDARGLVTRCDAEIPRN